MKQNDRRHAVLQSVDALRYNRKVAGSITAVVIEIFLLI